MKFFFPLTLLLLACNTLPVGFDQLTTLPESGMLELVPDSLDCYSRHIPLGYADWLLLGRDEQYESRVLLKFPLKDSALDSVTGVRLILHPLDSTPVTLVCRACSTEWTTAAVTWLLADSATRWLTPGGDLWEFTLGTATLTRESTVVELDRSRLTLLVQKSSGIMLLPTDTGFAAITNMTDAKAGPKLVFHYADGKERIYYATGDAHIVDTLNIRSQLTDLLIGASFAFRTYLKFRLDTLPPEVTILRAQLLFTPRTIYRRSDTLKLGVHRLTESYQLRNRHAGYEENAAATTAYIPVAQDTMVSLDITTLVQNWVSHPDSFPNHGLLITAEPEWQRPFRLKLSRSGNTAPQLKIQYILPPPDRFSR
ncbi:MAG: DNRLRE domain-containing protein [candidate division WOR-3 bacterium]